MSKRKRGEKEMEHAGVENLLIYSRKVSSESRYIISFSKYIKRQSHKFVIHYS